MQHIMMGPVALLVTLLACPAAGVTLRRHEVSTIDPPKPAAIKEKWDKMDEFLEIMFTMACTWKHGKDINGLAAEKLKKGELDGAAGYNEYVQEMQAKNVKGLERSCGMITASQKKTCRQGCATRWNANAEQRNKCDGKCVTVYANFERSCIQKADHLEKVYEQKQSKAEGQKQCYEGHCAEFPMVWMKAEEKDMKAEVETQCTSRCTDENVKAGCTKKWALEVDFILSSVAADCAEKSGVKKCFDKEKETTSASYDKCKTSTKETCDKAHTECTKKGKDERAKAFCDDRKKMCSKQADEKCLSENRAALDKAKTGCEKDASKDFKSCKDDTLAKKQAEAEKKCIAERGPTCKSDCQGKCKVEDMNKCLLMLRSEDDPSKMFCKDFWHLLHTSSEVDPVTGNPIVLLQSKSSVISPVI